MTFSCLFAVFLLQVGEDDSFLLRWARAIEEADLTWQAGDLEFSLSGLAEFQVAAFGDEAPGLTVEDPSFRTFVKRRFNHRDLNEAESPEAIGRLDVWGDVHYQDWLLGAALLRADRGTVSEKGRAWDARIEQVFLRVSPPDLAWLNVQVGKFAPPLGSFTPRHDAFKSPLIGWPIPYDHGTTLGVAEDTVARILDRRRQHHRNSWRPMIWREAYGTGGQLFGTVGEVEYHLAVMSQGPSSAPFEAHRHWDEFSDPNFYLRVAYRPHITTKLGASYHVGPYQRDIPGFDGDDFDQRVVGIDAEYGKGHFNMWGEVLLSTWETVQAGDLRALSYYLEAKYTLLPGFFVAGRVGQMRFDRIRDGAGIRRQWEFDRTRYELGIGYLFTQNLIVKLTGQLNDAMGTEIDDNLVALQLALGF